MSKLNRIQFSLRGLLVAVAIVAAFLAGRESQAWLECGRLPSDLYSFRLAVGESIVLNCKRSVPQAWVAEPHVCKVTPLSPTTIRIEGHSPGTAKVTLQFEDRAKRTSYDILVAP